MGIVIRGTAQTSRNNQIVSQSSLFSAQLANDFTSAEQSYLMTLMTPRNQEEEFLTPPNFQPISRNNGGQDKRLAPLKHYRTENPKELLTSKPETAGSLGERSRKDRSESFICRVQKNSSKVSAMQKIARNINLMFVDQDLD